MTALIVSFHLSSDSHADNRHIAENNAVPNIDIRFSGQGYSLNSENARLTDILLKLGDAADFKVKIFETSGDEQQDWSFDSISLRRLLDNLLRGHNTVMFYEEAQRSDASNSRRLRELWLIARYDDSGRDGQPMINLEIPLEPNQTSARGKKILTAEQEYKIDVIDKLEGLTSDDVIESLQQTLEQDEDPVVRRRAVAALADIGGTRVLDALESALGDNSGLVRIELARSFAGIKDQRSMLALGQLLMGDHDASVRRQAVHSLYHQNTLPAYLFVRAAVKDRDSSVSDVANQILLQWQPAPGSEVE